MPKRIQQRRVRGWRLPENAVAVSRPSVFGNPFKVGEFGTPADCVAAFEQWVRSGVWLRTAGGKERRERLLARIPELFGKDLACFCKESAELCHADILLKFAEEKRLEAERRAG